MLRGCSGAEIALLPFSQCSGIVRIEKKKSSTEITGMVFPKRRASVTDREKGIVYHPAIKLLRGVGTSFFFFFMSSYWYKHKEISVFSSLPCNSCD